MNASRLWSETDYLNENLDVQRNLGEIFGLRTPFAACKNVMLILRLKSESPGQKNFFWAKLFWSPLETNNQRFTSIWETAVHDEQMKIYLCAAILKSYPKNFGSKYPDRDNIEGAEGVTGFLKNDAGR